MFRFHLLGLLLAFLLTAVAALLTDLEARSLVKKTTGTKTRKEKPYPPSYTTSAPVVTCPSTAYYIQAADGSYFQAPLDTGYLPATTFDLNFAGTSTQEAISPTPISITAEDSNNALADPSVS